MTLLLKNTNKILEIINHLGPKTIIIAGYVKAIVISLLSIAKPVKDASLDSIIIVFGLTIVLEAEIIDHFSQ